MSAEIIQFPSWRVGTPKEPVAYDLAVALVRDAVKTGEPFISIEQTTGLQHVFTKLNDGSSLELQSHLDEADDAPITAIRTALFVKHRKEPDTPLNEWGRVHPKIDRITDPGAWFGQRVARHFSLYPAGHLRRLGVGSPVGDEFEVEPSTPSTDRVIPDLLALLKRARILSSDE